MWHQSNAFSCDELLFAGEFNAKPKHHPNYILFSFTSCSTKDLSIVVIQNKALLFVETSGFKANLVFTYFHLIYPG
jgi:hypothetical protein